MARRRGTRAGTGAGETRSGAGDEHRRADRVAAGIQRALGDLLMRRSRDPRLVDVSITAVRVSPDLRQARAFWVVLDDQVDAADVARALERATPFLRRGVGEAVNLRYVPELAFEPDRALAGARRIDALLREAGAVEPSARPADEGDPDDGDSSA